jgi:ABC-2 type transport system ATP-binding protein
MIQVSGLTKRYGARLAINNLHFEARPGEITGFLGPNGAGKTTTMRILTGYMPPSAGTATVAGFDILNQSLEVRRRVGYLPETVPLYPEMTAFDYLKFMADLRHLPNAAEIVDETLEMVGLEERTNSLIGNLSKGMRQRVGLAQALIHRPQVLILDEPTIGLDPGQVKDMRQVIREVGQERTVLLSTHILSEAQQLCDRILIINKGELVAEDTPEALQAKLLHAETGRIRVRGGDIASLHTSLSALPGIEYATLAAEDTIEFRTAPNKDMLPEVARLAVNSGFDLLELRPVGLSLEEIFLKLTREPETETEEA